MLLLMNELGKMLDDYAVMKQKIKAAEARQEELALKIMATIQEAGETEAQTPTGTRCKVITQNRFDEEKFKAEIPGWESVPALWEKKVVPAKVKKMYPEKTWTKQIAFLRIEETA